MTLKEYNIVCLLIDRNATVEVNFYGKSQKLYADDIKRLKEDLKTLMSSTDIDKLEKK